MLRILYLACLLVAFAPAAMAADNITITQGSGTTLKTKDVGGGVEESQVLLSDTSGNSILGTAGTANANAVTVQGIASMTPVLTNPGTAANIGVGATGSAVPANGIYNGVNVGGNLTGQIGCGSTAIYDASTSGSTQLVAISGSTNVRVCGYSILAAGTVNVKLISGTGTACATGSANITPAYQLTTQVGLVDGSPLFRGLAAGASNALCINTSAGVAVQAIIYFTQF